MSTDGQGTNWRRNISENFNLLSRVHKRYKSQTTDRRQTDGRLANDYSNNKYLSWRSSNYLPNLQ